MGECFGGGAAFAGAAEEGGQVHRNGDFFAFAGKPRATGYAFDGEPHRAAGEQFPDIAFHVDKDGFEQPVIVAAGDVEGAAGGIGDVEAVAPHVAGENDVEQVVNGHDAVAGNGKADVASQRVHAGA